MAGRYSCQKNKVVTISKANDYCLLAKCPELMVRRTTIVGGRLKTIFIRVVSELLVDSNFNCK